MMVGSGAAAFVLALPKGRILRELTPLLARVGLEPEPDFHDENSRKLRFATSDPKLEIISVRSFDVATFDLLQSGPLLRDFQDVHGVAPSPSALRRIFGLSPTVHEQLAAGNGTMEPLHGGRCEPGQFTIAANRPELLTIAVLPR